MDLFGLLRDQKSAIKVLDIIEYPEVLFKFLVEAIERTQTILSCSTI